MLGPLLRGEEPRGAAVGTAPIDLRLQREGRALRLTSALDDESERFEEELAAAVGELPLPQRHAWLRRCGRELRLLQLRDSAGRAAFQAAVYIARPRLLGGSLGHGLGRKLGRARSGEDELAGLAALRELLTELGDLVTLRLQPRREELRELLDFEARARLCGFQLCEPEGVTRTLLLDLQPDRDALLAALPKKVRYLLRSRERFTGAIRELDAGAAAACQAAAMAAMARTGAAPSRWDWQVTFDVARARPDLLRVVGLFLPGRPEAPLAFASACRHGAVAEYLSAGSLDDAELRKLPFNYWLLDTLFDWARDAGARRMDLGGVTLGGPADPLGGISDFKRRLTDVEVETGREMLAVLQPGRGFAVDTFRALRQRLAH